MKKKERIRLKGGAEWDALTPARKWYKYLTSPGVTASIKKGYNKRFRKNGKTETLKKFYRSLADLNLGRQISVFCKLK